MCAGRPGRSGERLRHGGSCLNLVRADVFNERVVVDEPSSFCRPSLPQGNASNRRMVTVSRAWSDELIDLRPRKLRVWTHALFRQAYPLWRIQVARGCVRTLHAFSESFGGHCQEVMTQGRCHGLRETSCTLGGFFFLVRGELVEGLWAGEMQQRNCGREHDWAVVDVHTPSTLIHPPSGAQTVPPSLINEAFLGLLLLQSITLRVDPEKW